MLLMPYQMGNSDRRLFLPEMNHMQLLIRNARVVHPESDWNDQRVDLLIENGILTKIGPQLDATAAESYDARGACISPGWLDVGTYVGDPGFEHREDFNSVARAAIAGGYTAIACLPNTNPPIHAKPEVQYVRHKAQHSPVDFLPIGAVSMNCQGKDIAEMYDMHAAGAVAFSDGKNSIQNSGLMLRALLYVRPFDGLIIDQPLDRAMAPHGQINEGEVSTSLGLPGIPALAEELMVQRHIYLAEYTGGRLHLLNISCRRSVELVRQAKAAGLPISASVAAMNLACDDSKLLGFDVNYKVMPPLRTSEDIEALRQGLLDGTIDFITSNHTPLDPEAKKVEFPFADFGAIGLETAFSLVKMAMPDAPESFIVEKLSLAPRRILRLEVPTFSEGAPADFTLFDPSANWIPAMNTIRSKSHNTPFIGQELPGKVLGIVRAKHCVLS